MCAQQDALAAACGGATRSRRRSCRATRCKRRANEHAECASERALGGAHQLERAHKNAKRAAQQAACGCSACAWRVSAREKRA
jgi:hypothetical protein